MEKKKYEPPELRALNTQQAINQLLSAAEAGDAKAQYMLGKVFEVGAGVQHDHEQALHWYRRAAETLLKKVA